MTRANGFPGIGRRRLRSPHGRRGGRRRLFAALDLGTNNCRLLIAQPAAERFRVVDGFSRIVRLGEGLTDSGLLSEAAIARTIAALKVCAEKIARHRVDEVRCVATEACRGAKNGVEFLDRVRRETGLELEIISAREEAELTLIGCLPLLDPTQANGLLFDVGGGSAELVWLEQRGQGRAAILGLESLPCGVVHLTERNGGGEFSPDSYAETVAEIEALLRPFEQAHGIRERILNGSAQMLGTAGTVTTISGVSMGLSRYDRGRVDGSVLTLDAVREVSGTLARSSFEERAAHPCIGAMRADLVVAGCAVLDAVCRTWPAHEIRVADRGVREGILSQLMAAHRSMARRQRVAQSQ